ncbi:MAG: aryldialkylphosphatase [Spirochaetes bacterium]|nr:MAG: aryldialkylphosphatase [Spirochaetota bacterium]
MIELRGKIQTVRGLIDPEDLGYTLMHEHILCDVTPPGKFPPGKPEEEITLENVWEINYRWCEHPGNSRLDQEQVAVRELNWAKENGVKTIVELSSIGMKRNPEGLRRLAESTGLNIIMGCGYYIEEFLPGEVKNLSIEQIEAEIVNDIVNGSEKSGIRSGIIGEIGCSQSWTDFERKVMRAAIIAQKETGAAINVHPYRSPDAGLQIIRFIEKHGGDPTRTIISHIDRTIFDIKSVLELAKSGCNIEYDFFGIETTYYPFQNIDLPNDGIRLKHIRALLDGGYTGQVLISHDICTKTRQKTYGGHGYSHILRNVVPLMKNRGFSNEEIVTILETNPRRILTFV